MATVHVIGAGLAGLACAVRLSAAGRDVVVWERAPQAGGRCRSYHDRAVDAEIDNGNHLLMSGNRAALGFLDEIGAADRLVGPPTARFPILDLADGRRFTITPNAGPIPWWVFRADRRLPDSRPWHYLRAARVALAGPGRTVGQMVPETDPLYRGFWEPLTWAVMNLEPERASAKLLGRVLRETFGKGAGACRPLIARRSLADTFITPALETLAGRGVDVRFGRRLRGLSMAHGPVTTLGFGDHLEPLERGDQVVLAVPPTIAGDLLPGLSVPEEGVPIVNAHFRLPAPAELPDGSPILGLLGGAAHWLFLRGDIASVTVSAADGLVDRPADALADLLWHDVSRALGTADASLPPYRIVKEKRATFTQTPENVARRPGPRTPVPNLLLAGDWTDTHLPATIEGSIRSGFAAAHAVQH